jgi:signal transduction histidine kinase
VDEQTTEASREKDLAVIEAEIERVNKIIKQFLDFARPRPPSLEPMVVRSILEETLALLVYEMEAQKISLERSYAPDLPPVPMDREQMKQVFLNLLLNAIQAMERGGNLKVATRWKPAPAGDGGRSVAEIAVQDSGPGMAEDIRSRIFEPFFSTKEEGIGLGLPIAQRIVEEHGGKIRVESRVGEGTTFVVTLPLQ